MGKQDKVQAKQEQAVSAWQDVLGRKGASLGVLEDLDAELLRDAVVAVVQSGDAVVVGMTADTSSLSFRILSDEGVAKFYVGTVESFEELLRAIRDRAKTF